MSNNDKRVLFTADAKFAFASSPNGGPGVLTGYALVWNTKSSDRGGFKVVLAPQSAQFETPTFALWNHDYNTPLARTDNGTLKVASDSYGVKVTIDLPDTTAGRDTYTNVKSGLVRGMSFGMLMAGAEFTTATDADGDEVDTFSRYSVDEVTITAIPAFVQTSIGVGGSGRDGGGQLQRADGRKKFADGKWEAAAHHAEASRHERYGLDLYPPSLADDQ